MRYKTCEGAHNPAIKQDCSFERRQTMTKTPKTGDAVRPNPEKKTGIESRRDDRVIINWTTRTVITQLGEFGRVIGYLV